MPGTTLLIYSKSRNQSAARKRHRFPLARVCRPPFPTNRVGKRHTASAHLLEKLFPLGRSDLLDYFPLLFSPVFLGGVFEHFGVSSLDGFVDLIFLHRPDPRLEDLPASKNPKWSEFRGKRGDMAFVVARRSWLMAAPSGGPFLPECRVWSSPSIVASKLFVPVYS